MRQTFIKSPITTTIKREDRGMWIGVRG
jgi:hypothetical protein